MADLSQPFTIENVPREHVAEQAFVDRFATDIRFLDDVAIGSDDDLLLVSGAAALRLNFERAIVTSPGELFWAPEYGVGLPQRLNEPITAALVDDIKNGIRGTLLAEPLVERISPLLVEFTASQPSTVRITVGVQIAGSQNLWELEIGSDTQGDS